MAVREILKMGDARLLRVAQPVREFGTPALLALIDDMLETMRAAQGAGLAAPQIGVDLQLVIFGFALEETQGRSQVSSTPSGGLTRSGRSGGALNERYPEAPPVPLTVLLNPQLTPLDDAMVDGWEGCLSVPGLRGLVPRHARIRYTGMDAHGRPIDREAEGFHARVVQHECDHLIGRLYPTRMTDLRQFGYTSVLFPGLDAAAADD